MTCEPVRVDGGHGPAPAARLPAHQPALLLARAAVVLSALHFWPFEQSRTWQRFGFYGSRYKYGAYVGILAPLCAVYLR